MNIVTRQIAAAMGLAFLIGLVLTTGLFFSFPLNNWGMLWETKVMDLPFILFYISLIVLIGIGCGIVAGMSWKRQLKEISDELYFVEQGRPPASNENYSVQELMAISKQIVQVHHQISEQTKLSQKLANDKAEDQEKRIQEMVVRERNRLARELHDSVSQQLFAASMLMSAITESNGDEDTGSAKQLRMVEGMIHQSQLEMRALLLHLRPVPLHDKSLQEGIEELLVELSQKVPMKVKWKLEPISLKKGIEDHLFRILQESVSNTLRHAKANSLEVLLIERDGLLILRIVDDGVGFDVEANKAGSYGMNNMYERAVEVGGTLKVISLLNKGTRLEVKIPMLSAGGEQDD